MTRPGGPVNAASLSPRCRGSWRLYSRALLPRYRPRLRLDLLAVPIEDVDKGAHDQVFGQARGEVDVIDQPGEPVSQLDRALLNADRC